MTLPNSNLLTHKYHIINNLLNPHEISNILDNNNIHWNKPLSSTRTITMTWKGAINLTDIDINTFKYVVLPDGRIDINLNTNLVQSILPNITHKINQLFNHSYNIHYINLLINPPNTNTQQWHQDNSSIHPDYYYTILIPLVDYPNMGKTQIITPYTYSFPHKNIKNNTITPITPNVSIGDALVFSGSLWHRGTPNLSKHTRYCLYIIITASHIDPKLLFEHW
jgi:hypothetical protein